MNPQALVSSATSGSGMFKMLVSGILGLLGMYFLATGKKEADVQKMLIGGALTLASFFFF